MGRESMGDFDYVRKRGKGIPKGAFRNSERAQRLNGDNGYSNSSKRKLRYLTTSADFVEAPEAHKRFYDLLTVSQKEVFGFLYVNPLEEILKEAKYLGNKARGELSKKKVDILGVREINEELSIYVKYLQICNLIKNRDLLKIAVNFKNESPRFASYFLGKINGLIDETIRYRRRLAKSLDDLASIV